MRLFVYGALMEGERSASLLHGADLIRSLYVPGVLYDTGYGYPAAKFDARSTSTVTGELYHLGDDWSRKLSELDLFEGTNGKLYKRRRLSLASHSFFSYEASEALHSSLVHSNQILSGHWRRRASDAKLDPPRFALRFAESEHLRYREFPPPECSEHIYLRGDIPVLVTAPHATRHRRRETMKYQDRFTGPLAVIAHAITGCHALYAHWATRIDPNYYDDSPFKEAMRDIVEENDIKFVIDLHATGRESPEDIYPGVGVDREFLTQRPEIFEAFKDTLIAEGLTPGSESVYKASVQMTVTKFAARKLGVAGMQLEIHDRLRRPDESAEAFMRLVSFLTRFINSANAML